MKTCKKPAVSKLIARFDNELKNLLTSDLKSFMDRHRFIENNNRANVQSTLHIA